MEVVPSGMASGVFWKGNHRQCFCEMELMARWNLSTLAVLNFYWDRILAELV